MNERLTRLFVLIPLVAGAGEVDGQEDSVTISAGSRYAAGNLKAALLGDRYRDLWTAPITVPVLDPDTFAGGLTLLQRGGGRQTASLRFGAKDGREFVFRSVDKNQSGGLHADLRETWIDDIIQDQVSSKHPGAALVVAPLLAAAGVLHASPTLAVMADHPALEEYRSEFAGMLGTIEARPTETDGAGRFGRYERLIGTERLLERLEEGPEDRVDAPAYLRARLMDILVGDWDRHDDQWRWAQTEVGERRVWFPIPRDRDNAFFHADGLLGVFGREIRPYVIKFEERYPGLLGLTYNSGNLDRRILPELGWSEWNAVVLDLQGRLSDGVIADAVRQLPPPYYDLSGPELERKLIARRDGMRQVARRFFAQINHEVDIWGTDESERATIEHGVGGGVRVRLTSEEHGTYYDRVFVSSDTREVRLRLLGGPDTTVVSGTRGSGIVVRVEGGGGDDYFEDRSDRLAGPTHFYDDGDDENVFLRGRNTTVDTRVPLVPEPDTLTQNNPPPPRDWGSRTIPLRPTLGWTSDVGPVIGAGPTLIRYGFRRFPFAWRTRIAVLAAPFENRFGLTAEFRRVRTGSGGETRLTGAVSQISLRRFHGFGNETSDGPDPDRMLVWATEYSGTAEISEVIGPNVRGTAALTATRLEPEPLPGSPAQIQRVPGSGPFTVAGLRASAVYDGRDLPSYPTRGTRVSVTTVWYPLVLGDVSSGFVRSGILATTFARLPVPLETTLALRTGGETLWGEGPFQFAPSVGGRSSLRGHRTDRFTGDASLFGGIELRSKLGRLDLLLVRGDFGTIGLADAGKVFVTEQRSDAWHSAFGGGLWFGAIDRRYTGHVVIVQGERLTLNAGFGVPF